MHIYIFLSLLCTCARPPVWDAEGPVAAAAASDSCSFSIFPPVHSVYMLHSVAQQQIDIDNKSFWR